MSGYGAATALLREVERVNGCYARLALEEGGKERLAVVVVGKFFFLDEDDHRKSPNEIAREIKAALGAG